MEHKPYSAKEAVDPAKARPPNSPTAVRPASASFEVLSELNRKLGKQVKGDYVSLAVEDERGSCWLADLPVNPGSPTAQALRAVQGRCSPLCVAGKEHPRTLAVLVDANDVRELWRFYRWAE